MFQLRPYQEKCIEDGINYIKDPSKTRPVIIVMPTAAGKSIIVTRLAASIPETDMVICLQPSVELLKQNYAKFISEGGDATIYSASANQKVVSRVMFCTPGSVKTMGPFFKTKKVGLILVDECHIGIKKDSMIDKFIQATGCKKVIGLTATPVINAKSMNGTEVRMMNRTPLSRFSDIIHVTQIADMVNGGYWTKLRYALIDTDTSMLELNSTKSDYTKSSLDLFETRNDILNQVLRQVKRCINQKHVLIFMESIEKARQMEQITNDHYGKIVAVSVDSKDEKKRTKGVADFLAGRVKYCINVGILTTGFDFPALQIIIDARPTNSIIQYYQRIGRLVRILEGKEMATYVDLSGNYDRFGAIENIWIEKHPTLGWHMRNLTNNTIITTVNPKALELYYGGSIICSDISAGFETIPFGKYSGWTVEEVYRTDEQYITKFLYNMDSSSKTRKAAISYTEYKRGNQFGVMKHRELV